MIKSIVFDWNGTLLSDTEACNYADNLIFKKLGCKPLSIKQFRETFEVPVLNMYITHGADKKTVLKNQKEISEIFHEGYEKRAKKVRTRKNAKEILKYLHKNKVKSIILSNHTTYGVNLQLERLGLKKYIEDALTNDSKKTSINSRNKLTKLENYMKKYKKSEVIIVGDSSEEVEIGKKVGIKTIAITNGFCSTKRLKASNPDYLINNLIELKSIIEELK